MVGSIVLTGGPGAGKTRILSIASARWARRVVAVPEAATQVYRQLRTRWSELDDDGRRDVQRRIYALQIEQERRLRELHPDRVLLLDRGTLDGAAYWPDGPEDYWRALGTSLQAELARYDAVIELQSCAALGAYDGSASNPWRSEQSSGAIALDERLRGLWRGHRNYHEIGACADFSKKLAAALALIEGWIGPAAAGKE